MVAAMSDFTGLEEWPFCFGTQSRKRRKRDLSNLKWVVRILTILDSSHLKNTGAPSALNFATGGMHVNSIQPAVTGKGVSYGS